MPGWRLPGISAPPAYWQGRSKTGHRRTCWGEPCISEGDDRPGPLFALSSREIILLRRHPGAISARNLFKCTVTGTFPAGAWVGMELDCRGERLVAEIVRAAAGELGETVGSELYAAIKASSFRKLN